MENRENASKDQSRISRRDFLIGGAKGVGAVVAGVAAEKLGLLESFLPKDEKDGTEKQEELSHLEIFAKLKEKINSAEGIEREKDRVFDLVDQFEKIMDVNDRLVSSMNADIDPDSGKPHLVSLYEKKYKRFGIEDPASMMFIINNDRKSNELIIKPLMSLLTDESIPHNQNANGIYNYLYSVRESVSRDEGNEGEFKYISGPHIRLLDYLTVDAKRKGRIEIGAGKEVTTAEGKSFLETDIAHAQDYLDNVSLPGDARVNLWSGVYNNGGEYPFPGSAGAFLETGENSQIHLTSSSAFVLGHEVGHYLDPSLNDTQLYDYLSPEGIYDLLVSREEALSNSEWGRNYSSIEDAFLKKQKYIPVKDAPPFVGKITPPGGDNNEPLKLSDIRNNIDGYPDKIFFTGIYSNKFTNENPFMMRQSDRDVFFSTMLLFGGDEKTSWTFEEFLNKEENIPLFDVIGEKSPWQKKVISKLREIAPIIDGRLDWLNSSTEDDNGERKDVIVAPHAGSRDGIWFDFYTGVAQRLAIIDMFFKQDPSLAMLKSEEIDEFRESMISPFLKADFETFANMIGVTIERFNETVESSIPNPYTPILETYSKELADKETSLVPGPKLMDFLKTA